MSTKIRRNKSKLESILSGLAISANVSHSCKMVIVMSHDVGNSVIFTARKWSLRRLCFYTCLSVHSGGSTWAGAPSSRQVHPPAGIPLGRYTPPPKQVQPSAGAPPGQVHPPGRYTPPEQVHPQGRSTSGWYASHWNATSCMLRKYLMQIKLLVPKSVKKEFETDLSIQVTVAPLSLINFFF